MGQQNRHIRGRAGARGWTTAILSVAAIAVAAAVRIWDPAPVEALRLAAFDLYQRAAPRVAEDAPVVIVDIDDRSLQTYGQWPWPRTRLADLIDAVSASGAATIGLDILLSEPDRLSPAVAVEDWPQVDDALRARVAEAPDNDAVLAAAVARARVVLAWSGVRAEAGGPLADGGPTTSIAALGGAPGPYLVGFPALLRALPELEAAAAGRGLVSLRPEIDGVVRRAPALAAIGGAPAPSLVVEMLRVATGDTTILAATEPNGVRAIAVGGVEIPTDASGQIWVHFAPYDPARYVSAADVLAGDADPARLAGRLVLIGASAVGLLDQRPTPLDPSTPGVEIHAQLLETILTGAHLTRPDYALGAELTLLALLIVAAAIATQRLSARGAAFAALAASAAVAFGVWRLFVDGRMLIDATWPLLAGGAAFAVGFAVSFRREERTRGVIRNAFARYLTPQMVDRVAADPSALQLGGETRELTVLFADMRGFSAVAEALKDDPQALTQTLNAALTPLSHAVLERDGVIDKYFGDALMAFWNAPIDVEAHAVRACDAALDMQRRLAALNAERSFGAAPIRIGVGVNTGACVVGNLGSDLRFDYSALGDPVNVASRLEGLTRVYGVDILVGEETARLCGDRMALLAVDDVVVFGKATAQTVFALVGDVDAARSDRFQRARDALGEAREVYRARSWAEAQVKFEAVRSATAPGAASAVAEVFLRRIEGFQTTPPPDDWDGVHRALGK